MRIIKKRTMDETGAKETMISNLPLLFANGYPTSLEKITEKQLENFIPFMVQCSYGKINIPSHETVEPEWWPEDVAFEKPFGKPHKFQGDWLNTMKGIVLRCYSHHQSEFLINFCKDLTVYDHASLRFINNFNSTTSLYERRSNRLLVTFRNENMSYDQPQKTRKCLLQKSNRMNNGMVKMMESPSPFEIYLCDNCDAELYSEDAMKEHEKMCASDDDDVIFCDSPTPEEVHRPPEPNKNKKDALQSKSPLKHTSPTKTIDAQESRQGFLLNFFLRPKGCTETYDQLREASIQEDDGDSLSSVEISNTRRYNKKKLGAIARRTRGQTTASTLNRCPQIPFSSPAGQFLMKKSKTVFTTEYLNERLDRLERFSAASPLVPGMPRPKIFDRRTNNGSVFITYRKPSTSSSSASRDEPETAVYERIYNYPRRQFSTKKRDEDMHYLNELLQKQCRPLSVRLKKIDSDFLANHKHLAQLSPPTAAKLLNIKLTRDARKSSKWKISPSNSANTSTAEIIVDTIDLCSSDEEDDGGGSENAPTLDDNSNSSKSQDSTREPSLKRVCLERSSSSSSIQSVLQKLNSEITLTPIRNESVLHRIEGNFVMSPTSTPPPPNNLPPPPTFEGDLLANLQNQENFDRNKQQPPQKRRSESVIISKQRRTIGSITNNNNTANISNSNLSLSPSGNTTLPILQFNRVESIDLTL